jgi:hypothetical protein
MTVPDFGNAPNSTTVQVECRECGETRAVIFAINVDFDVAKTVLKAGFERVADWLLAHYGAVPEPPPGLVHEMVEMGLADPGAIPKCPGRRFSEPMPASVVDDRDGA